MLEQLNEIIQNFGGIASSLTVIIGFSAVVIKPIRKKVVSWIKSELNTERTFKEVEELRKDIEGLDEKVNLHVQLLNKHIEDSKNRDELDNEASLFQLRQVITDIYYDCMKKGKIPPEVRENLLKGYCIYKEKGGNSYIARIVQELLELPIDL